MVLPFLYMSERMTTALGLGEFSSYKRLSLGLESFLLIVIVIWGLISVSRLLVSVKKNYVDAYDKHKREYIEMAIVIVPRVVLVIENQSCHKADDRFLS